MIVYGNYVIERWWVYIVQKLDYFFVAAVYCFIAIVNELCETYLLEIK